MEVTYMAIEALKSVGAVYQASSTPEVAKETSQPKTQIIDIQTGAAAMAADAVKVNAKETNEQQGSGQESQGKAESENLKKAVEQINQKMSDSEAVFGIHEKTNRITIKIVDKKKKQLDGNHLTHHHEHQISQRGWQEGKRHNMSEGKHVDSAFQLPNKRT